MFHGRENQQLANGGSSFADGARELGRLIDEIFTSFIFRGIPPMPYPRKSLRSAPADEL
jgi:hypothetical protein